jgi:uncharacterized protein (DUF433 family)
MLVFSETGKSMSRNKMNLDRIQINPKRMNGQATIRNLRLTVRRVIKLVALYPNREELKQEYPELEDLDIEQALMFAAMSLDDRIIDLFPNAIAA